MIKLTFSKKTTSLFIVLVLAAFVIGWFLLKSGNIAVPKSEAWHVLDAQQLKSQIALVGRVEAAKRHSISAPFDGIIEKVFIEDGQRVSRSQVLLKVDSSVIDVQIRQAESEMLKARQAFDVLKAWDRSEEVARARRAVATSQLAAADTDAKLADARRLFERGLVPRAELDTLLQQKNLQSLELLASRSDLERATAKNNGVNQHLASSDLANAQVKLQNLLASRSRSSVLAPFDGVVLRPSDPISKAKESFIQVGRKISEGSTLFEVASTDELVVVARIEETDLSSIKVGMLATVSGPGFDNVQLAGKVKSVGAQALVTDQFSSGSNFEVSIAISNPSQVADIRLGMSAKVEIATYSVDRGFIVPTAALRQSKDARTFVFYKKNSAAPIETVFLKTGRAFPEGVEVFGVNPGLVLLGG